MASPARPGWRFILHGGCANTCPDVDRQRDLKHNLGLIANATIRTLNQGASAKHVVVQIISALEDCPLFNAGKGSAFTRDGVRELEAGIVDGHSTAYGAVCCVTATKNPILAANALLEHGPHCMLVGQAADDMSKKLGLETVANNYFSTAFRRAHWEQQGRLGDKEAGWEVGTVGAVVLDSHGQLAAGGSTGGITGKLRGRIGDTAVLGAGLYANSRVGVVCSGAGDQIFQHLLATKVANYHASGLGLNNAARRAVSEMSSCSGKPYTVATIDSDRKISVQSTACVFYTVSGSSNNPPHTFLCPTTLPITPQHIIYNDTRLIIGLSRYPTTPGHTLVIPRESDLDFFLIQIG